MPVTKEVTVGMIELDNYAAIIIICDILLFCKDSYLV